MGVCVSPSQLLLEDFFHPSGDPWYVCHDVNCLVLFQFLEIIALEDGDMGLVLISLRNTSIERSEPGRISEYPPPKMIIREIPHHDDGGTERPVAVTRQRLG